MKEFERNFFALLFFGLWIVVLYHLVTNSSGAVAVTRGVGNQINAFFGTLFGARAVTT